MGDFERQRAAFVRNPWNLRQVDPPLETIGQFGWGFAEIACQILRLDEGGEGWAELRPYSRWPTHRVSAGLNSSVITAAYQTPHLFHKPIQPRVLPSGV